MQWLSMSSKYKRKTGDLFSNGGTFYGKNICALYPLNKKPEMNIKKYFLAYN